MRTLLAATSIIGLFALASTAQAQYAFQGYLGVYVTPGDDGGMAITGFIRDTPAARLNRQGEIRRRDVIVKLAGKDVNTLNALRRARDTIPFGSEGKLVLRGPGGEYYYVWISRKDPNQNLYLESVAPPHFRNGARGKASSKAAGGAGRATGGRPPRAQAPADEMHRGAKGRGDDQEDVRPIGEKGDQKGERSESSSGAAGGTR